MSTTTLLLIILIALVIGIKAIKSTLTKSTVAVIKTVDNGAEVLFLASTRGKEKAQVYLLDGVEEDQKRLQTLKTKYPNYFLD